MQGGTLVTDPRGQEPLGQTLDSASKLNTESPKQGNKSKKKKRRSKARKCSSQVSASVSNPANECSAGRTTIEPGSVRQRSVTHQSNTTSCRSVVPVHPGGMVQSWLETSGSTGQAFMNDLVYGSSQVPEWTLDFMVWRALPSLMAEGRRPGRLDWYELPLILTPNASKDYYLLSGSELIEKVLEIPRDQFMVPSDATLRWQKESLDYCTESHISPVGEIQHSSKKVIVGKHIARAMNCMVSPAFSGFEENVRLRLARKHCERALVVSEFIGKISLRVILGKYHLHKYMTSEKPQKVDVSDLMKILEVHSCFGCLETLTVQRIMYFLGQVPGFQSKGNVNKIVVLHEHLMANHEQKIFTNPACFSLEDYLLLATEEDERVDRILEDNACNTLPTLLINSYIYLSKYERGEKRYKRALKYLKNKSTVRQKAVFELVEMIFLVNDFQYVDAKPKRTEYLEVKERINARLISARNKMFPDDYKWVQCIGYGLRAIVSKNQVKQSSILRKVLNKDIASDFEQAARRGFVVHWGDAATHYAESGFWEKAVYAAERMADHCEDALMKLHWEERVHTYQTSCEKKPIMPEIKPDPVMDEVEEPVVINSDKKKKIKARTRKRGNQREDYQQVVKPGVAVSKNNESVPLDSPGVTYGNEMGGTNIAKGTRSHKIKSRRRYNVWTDKICLVNNFVDKYKNNIVDVGRMFIENIDEKSMQEGGALCAKEKSWKTVTHKNRVIDIGSVHLIENWNPVVVKFLRNIDEARLNDDFDGEIDCASELLGTSESVSLIGIERCYEEVSWSLLHIFDDLFNSLTFFNAHETTALKQKLIILKMAKILLLSSIARHLNMDSLNSNVSFHELKGMVREHIGNCKKISGKVFSQTLFRMRCLMSSMGHFHSVSAFLSPANSERFKERAILYYEYKKYLQEQICWWNRARAELLPRQGFVVRDPGRREDNQPA